MCPALFEMKGLMELLCICCGKPWDVEYVLREATTEFDREGALFAAVRPVTASRRKG